MSALRRILVPASAVALVAMLSFAAVRVYPGNSLTFAFFTISFGAMMALLFFRPRSFAYTFLATFLFLGFWVKVTAHLVFDVRFLEPTGQFDGSASQWDAALGAAGIGALGATLGRVLQMSFFGRRYGPTRSIADVPSWYRENRSALLVTSIVAIVLLHGLNLLYSFYQIGVVPKLVLPWHLNVPIAWLLSIGLAIWAAMLAGWEVALQRDATIRPWMLPLAEAVCSNSTLSRASYLFRVLPYMLAALTHRARVWQPLRARAKLLLVTLVVVGFAISLVAVSLLRVVLYPPLVLPPQSGPAPPITSPGAPVTPQGPSGVANALARNVPFAVREVQGLFVRRWIGTEGVLAVTSHSDVGPDLFARAVVESPRMAQDSIYQELAKSQYASSDTYNFLTVPGAMAVLAYAGSPILMFLGMLVLTALCLIYEAAAMRLIRNPFVVSIIGLSLANSVAQMNFPYLFGVFLVEQATTILLLGAITARLTPTRAVGSLRAALTRPRTKIAG